MKVQFLLGSLVFSVVMFGQAPNPTQTPAGSSQVVTLDRQPLYKVTVVSRSVKAVNYRHRSGATKVDLQGTALMPKAHGEAKVNSKQGYLEVNANFHEVSSPSQFGPEYLTYVLWAITPEGRATNLGEVLTNTGTDSKLDVTTELQVFALIVTAEPYFAVTQPSDVVVMENIIRGDTKGQVEELDAKYELLQRGQYVFNVDKSRIKPINITDPKVPIELYEARNAVQIARWTGADHYASDTFQKAEASLARAEDYLVRKQWKPTSMLAREAAQTAEDARAITIKRMDAERLAQERQAAADRELQAKNQATQARVEADQSKSQADEAVRQRQQAELQRAQAELESKRAEEQRRLEAQRAAQAEQQAQMEATRRQQAEAERLAAEKAKADAVAAQQAAQQERAAADAARQAAIAQQQLAQQETEKARQAAAESDRMRMKAEGDKEALRQQLLQQFNMILQTRDSARGLIVNMSDVLFDTGKYTLRPAAREKLAKISGIVLAHPGLKLEVEGHTDSVGSDSYNQTLSEERANGVRAYLIAQGLQPDSVTAKGFGKSMPVVSNDTAAGRQQNRRVELVVSGDIIGGTSVIEMKRMYNQPATGQPVQRPPQ